MDIKHDKKRKAARKARSFETRTPKLGAYLIVAEGEKTEPLYFKALGKSVTDVLGGEVDIRIEGQGRGTTALVEKTSGNTRCDCGGLRPSCLFMLSLSRW